MQLFWPTLYMQMMLLNRLVTDHFKRKYKYFITSDSNNQRQSTTVYSFVLRLWGKIHTFSTPETHQLPEGVTHGRVSQNNYVTTITSQFRLPLPEPWSASSSLFLNLDKSGACLYDLHNIKSTTNETTVVDSKHSTSAMLIWIDAWSFAEMIRLLAELKHDTKQLHTVAQCSIVPSTFPSTLLLWLILFALTMSYSPFTVHCQGDSVAEWLACWTRAQKGPGSNRSRDAVG